MAPYPARTEDQLLDLCDQAGLPLELVTCEQEPLGINLFCVARKE
jgi:hypothetical protein